MARSVRIISSSLLITKFPGLVLENEGQPDTGSEAQESHQSAKIFMTSFERLVRILQRTTTRLNAFRGALIGYRFSLRNFLTAIDAWKQIDRDRLKHSFEVAYCESYMVIWTSEKMLEKLTEQLTVCSDEDRPALLRERDENEAFIKSGQLRMTQFREMLSKLLGPRGSRDLLEELDAYLTSCSQAMRVEVQMLQGEGGEQEQEQEQRGVSLADPDRSTDSVSGGITAAPRPPAASGSSSTSTSTSAADPPLSPEMVRLRRVSMMTGLGENHVLHELCLNAKFQVPDPLPPLRAFNSQTDGYVPTPSSLPDSALMELMQRDPRRGKEVLKQMMIRTIEDRFVANMTQSSIHVATEVGEVVYMYIYIYCSYTTHVQHIALLVSM